MKTRSPLIFIALACAAAVTLGGCASGPGQPPNTALQKANYEIGHASQSKAGQYAKLQLYNARQKLKQAKQLVNNEDATQKDYAKARRLAKKATVDAQLAKAKAQSKHVQKQAASVQSNLRALKQQTNDNEEGRQ